MTAPTRDHECSARKRELRQCCRPRAIRFSRWGLAEDPTGEIIITRDGRTLAYVTATYRRETPAAIMLRLRHMDGSDAGECAASYALILPGHFHAKNDDAQ